MLKQFKAIIGVTAVAGMASFIAPGGEALPVTGTMVADPAGPFEPGAEFRVTNASGSECEGGEVTGTAAGLVATWNATPDETGDWEVQLEVPADATPGDYTITAECVGMEPLQAGFGAPAQDPQVILPYEAITVTVVAPAQEPEPEPTPPPAAAPVVETPTFTG